MAKDKKVCVRIEQELLTELQLIKNATGITISDVINTSINTFVINNTTNPDSEFIKSFKSKLAPEQRSEVVWVKKTL